MTIQRREAFTSRRCSLMYIADMNIRNIVAVAVLLLWLAVGVTAQWTKGVGLPDSMSIIRSVVRGDNGLLVAGSWGDGVFVSSDDGYSWTSTSTGFPTDGTRYVTVNTAAILDGHVYVGTSLRGIWKYDQTRAEWKHLRGFDSTTILSMTVHNGVIYAGCFRSGLVRIDTNDDVALEYVPVLGDGFTVSHLVSAKGTLYVGTSRDGWNVYDPETKMLQDDNQGFLTQRPFSAWSRAVADDGSSITAVLGENLVGGGVYARASANDEWQRYDDGLPLDFQTVFGAASVGTTYVVSTGYFGGLGVYVRTRGEQQWSAWNDGLPHLDIEGVVVWRRNADTVRVVISSREIGLWYRDTVLPTTSVYEIQDVAEPLRPTFLVNREDLPAFVAREGLTYVYDVAGRRYSPDAIGTGWFLGQCLPDSRRIVFIVH